MLRLIYAFLCAVAACMLVARALSSSAQSTTNFKPDPFVSQVTSSARDSFAGDMTANGRFVVITSNGDIATEKVATFNASGTPNPNARNNEDGNREIFLYDYAQRRIFQLTNTKSVLNPSPSPSVSPSPSPSPSPGPSPSVSTSPTVSPTPTPFPTPTPVDNTSVAIEISSNRPMISLEPQLVAGQRTYTIVFSSNAPISPANFDGTDPDGTLAKDGNQEIWTYQFTVPDTADLSSGAEVPFQDLSNGTFKRITDTKASIPPMPGSSTRSPVVADDNRDATISDDGKIVAFASTRNQFGVGTILVGPGNSDGNPEIFLVNVSNPTLTF